MHVLLVDDDDTFRTVLRRELLRRGHRISEAATGAEGLARAAEDDPDVALLDLSLPGLSGIDVLKQLRRDRPDIPVVMLTAHGTIDSAISALKLGAYDFLQKPAPLQAIELTLDRAYERRRLGEENERLRDGLQAGRAAPEFIGHGPQHEALQRLIAKVAASDSTVLVQGETGTGKEVVAATIHRLSRRREQPFVVVDCASLNDNLLQSELFGHERGAFTGAVRTRHGLFEAADGGTVFLDEVGDVSPALQAGLLRILETSTFRRLGGTREVRVDVRLIAATHRDLERLKAEGRFRQDLFFRLSAIHVAIPPLRGRREEIPHFVRHFTDHHNARGGARKAFSTEALEALQAYDWPGNVRELRHAVDHSLVLADGEIVGIGDLPVQVRPGARRSPAAPEPVATLSELERTHIAEVLALAGGHRARAAAMLGISERNLYRKLREYRLDVDEHLDDPART
jgi:DNA-binding NtrC family response regulator